jgi:acetolactate decarboxylase
MNRLFSYLIIFGFSFTLLNCGTSVKSSTEKDKVYQCPMKCEGEKTYDKPGKCGVCGMKLEAIDKAPNNDEKNNPVSIVGAMKNVMHKGELFGTIDLDTIANKEHLYGIGPLEYLKGELLIIDGKSYKSTVGIDGSIKMEETYKAKAPFFVYTNVENWIEHPIPDSVQTILQLETYLDQITKTANRPFAFKLTGTVETATIHIVNLPDGTVVHSPEDAHKNQREYELNDEAMQIIGFFSTEHQAVFTHHDTYVHIHGISDDKSKMGHLDKLVLKKGTVKLFLPQ